MKYVRKINYYETDRMGITHHSNYIRYIEEARCNFMDKMKLPYSKVESEGFMIPVLSVSCDYKYSTTFDDEITIDTKIAKNNGVRIEFEYIITKADGSLVAKLTSSHCFTDKNLRPINLKKVKKDWFELIEKYRINDSKENI